MSFINTKINFMEKNFQYKTATVNYTIEGKGDAVLLLHGFGEDSSIWKDQFHFLKEDYTVITPDLPGSGKSSILEQSEVSIIDYASCIFALLENENIEKCYLLGHSMGGYITLAFADDHPKKLLGFGLINSTAFADSPEKKKSRLQGIEMIKEHGGYSFLKTAIPTLFSKNFKNEHPEIVTDLVEKSKQFSNEALMQYYTAMMNRPDTTAVLQNTEVRVLFVIGTEDNAAPLNDLLQQIHLPKMAQIHILDGIGHMSMLEAGEKLNSYLLEYLGNN